GLVISGLRNLILASSDDPQKYLRALDHQIARLRERGLEVDVSVADPTFLAQELDRVAIAAYVADGGSLRTVYDIQEICLKAGKPFLPAAIVDGQAMLGPLVWPEAGPCWLCALLRYSANEASHRSTALWQDLFLGGHFDGALSDLSVVPLRMLGNGLAFELFKVLTGCLSSGTQDGVIIQNVETLESSQAHLARHPLCPSCSHMDPDLAARQLFELIARNGNGGQAEGGLDKHYYYINSRVGMFKELADEDISQLPLKVARIIAAPPMSHLGGFEITSFSIENLRDARDAAFREAVRRYGQELPDRRGMICASYNQMKAAGKEAFLPQQLSTWSGTQEVDEDTPLEWMPALPVLSNFSERLCYVPAAAVYPYSALNRWQLFDRVSAGSAAGATFASVLEGGLLSALSYEGLRDLMRGCGTVATIPTDGLIGAEDDLAYLLKCAERFGQAVNVLRVYNSVPVRIVLAYAAEAERKPSLSVGFGLTEQEAMRNAL
ncbi:MAG: hypothetical protein CVT68_11885, partial [Actinobacteria bacterium HGW-Actinobacteria-8]